MADFTNTRKLSRRTALKGGAAVAVAAAVPTAVLPKAPIRDETYREQLLALADKLDTWDGEEKYCIVRDRQTIARVMRVMADWEHIDDAPAGAA